MHGARSTIEITKKRIYIGETKMATLEDKILGNKLENYCSSSEDEDGYEDACDGGGGGGGSSAAAASSGPTTAPPPAAPTFYSNVEKWSGQSANTGPKGVIKDWQRFKQLETERNEEKERERLQLLKKLSITAKTVAEDQQQREQDELDAELAELLSDGTLLEFQRQRMQEMMAHCGGGDGRTLFGKVLPLNTGDDFLTAVDKAPAQTTVIIHIYESHLAACTTMNRCLVTLAEEYGAVKFCKIFGSVAGLSKDFKAGGIPALLVYKAGGLIGNFVRVSDDLGGDDFYASDVESFLIEHGMLPDKTHAPVIIEKKGTDDSDDDD